MTAQTLIDQAFRLIGVLQAGRTAATQEYANCLDALNQLVLQFSVEGLTIYQVKKESFSLTGATSYTIGSGATFNTARPEKIRAAAVITAAGVSMPCEIVTFERFARIIDRGVTGSFADFIACDYQFPSATLYLWPAPTGGTLELASVKPLSTFATLSDAVAFPPGYEAALKFALAVQLADEYNGSRLSANTVAQANATKQALAAINGVALGAPSAPSGPVPMQQPLTEIDIERGKAA